MIKRRDCAMKQIKIFYYIDTPDTKAEREVNAWIAENNINVVDARFGSYCTPNPDRYHECLEVMVIYEVEAT